MQRQKPFPPDGSEVYIGAVIALAAGGLLFWWGYPWWAYMLVSLLIYALCLVVIQNWSEDDRQYWRADALAQTINGNLKVIEFYAREISNRDARQNIADGVANTRAIVEELRTKKPTQFYGGLIPLEPQVRRMLSVKEYVEITQNPRKAGDKYQDVVSKAEQGFQGFAEETQRLLERTNAGDIFELTVNAEMLRSLRNLLDQNQGEIKS